MKVHLKVWRQKNKDTPGRFFDYTVDHASPDMSFLELIDTLNINLVHKGEEPVAFDHDCREGICGSCSMVINGCAHGPETGTATCQLHMRKFKDGETIVVEPFRARAFPIIKDLSVDRTALDRVMQAGGFVSVNTGNAPEANSQLVSQDVIEVAMDAAQCIGCGACVASCKNASAMLFVSAKVSHLALLPQGQPERSRRALSMVNAMDAEGFGACSNTGACEAACPKEIKLENIARLNRELFCAALKHTERKAHGGEG